jgi:ABC-2 type transport system ATP-binding protein
MHKLSKTYPGGKQVLKDISLSFLPGAKIGVVGLNGAGKSTLMRLALGMLRPDSGEVVLDGRPLARAPRETWCRVGHLVEVPLAYPELSARQNLALAARLHGASASCVDAAIEQWKLAAYADRRVRRLSLGNRQRVGLAAALQHRPRLVVLDEPTNALDPAGVLVLRDALLRRADEGAGVLVSSHHLDEVARIAHRIVMVNGGRLIGELSPASSDLERSFFEHVRLDDERREVTA